jgi:hypothetical protein
MPCVFCVALGQQQLTLERNYEICEAAKQARIQQEVRLAMHVAVICVLLRHLSWLIACPIVSWHSCVGIFESQSNDGRGRKEEITGDRTEEVRYLCVCVCVTFASSTSERLLHVFMFMQCTSCPFVSVLIRVLAQKKLDATNLSISEVWTSRCRFVDGRSQHPCMNPCNHPMVHVVRVYVHVNRSNGIMSG